jgi:hypothetical protein
MPEKTFQDTGLGDETFPYVQTDAIPCCLDCRYRYNLPVVPPCYDCNGITLPGTGHSYFQEMTW